MKIPSPFESLIRSVITRIRETTRTAVVGRVSDYDGATQTATVTPQVPEEETIEGTPRELPPTQLRGIPIVHHGGSLRGLTFGLADDDPVVLVVRHRSHQEVDDGAAPPISPQDSRRMALSEAVAIPGYTPGSPGQTAAHFRSDGQPVLYMDAGEALHLAVATASIALARADLVESRLDALVTSIESHTHTGVTAGTGVSGAPGPLPGVIPVPGSNDVASTRVKVDK